MDGAHEDNAVLAHFHPEVGVLLLALFNHLPPTGEAVVSAFMMTDAMHNTFGW